MLSRAEFDRFLQLYGIPTSDARYEQYKKSQSTSLANQQFAELASQVKQNVTKPKYPNLVIGPGTQAENQAAMDKYNKQMAEYNKQQNLQKELLKRIQKGMADKIKYYDQQEKLAKQKSAKEKSTGTTIPYKTPEDLKKVKGHLDKSSGLTPEQAKRQEQLRRPATPAKIAKHERNPAKPVIKKPNPIPNTHQHINHNIMSFQQYKDFQLNQGFGVGMSEYKHYLQRFHLNNPTPYLKGQMTVENNKQGHSSLAKGQSIEEHNKTHSKNIIQHLTQGNVAVPGQIEKKTPPQTIVIHAFDKPTPAHNEHSVESHSLNKEARNKAGNPNNPPPKVVSGPRNDNHLNPTQQKTADLVASAMTSGIQAGSAFAGSAVTPAQPIPPPAPPPTPPPQKEIPEAIM